MNVSGTEIIGSIGDVQHGTRNCKFGKAISGRISWLGRCRVVGIGPLVHVGRFVCDGDLHNRMRNLERHDCIWRRVRLRVGCWSADGILPRGGVVSLATAEGDYNNDQKSDDGQQTTENRPE